MKKLIAIVALGLLLLAGIGCTPRVFTPTGAGDADTGGVDFYDNGKNLLFYESTNVKAFFNDLQRWIDDHPDKRIVSVSTDSRALHGNQLGWLVVYERRPIQ